MASTADIGPLMIGNVISGTNVAATVRSEIKEEVVKLKLKYGKVSDLLWPRYCCLSYLFANRYASPSSIHFYLFVSFSTPTICAPILLSLLACVHVSFAPSPLTPGHPNDSRSPAWRSSLSESVKILRHVRASLLQPF